MNLLSGRKRRITQQVLKAFAKIRLIYLKTKGKIKIIEDSSSFFLWLLKKEHFKGLKYSNLTLLFDV